ncbi:MAG: shikimate kinase [Gemmatimonadaceae bacterium]
MPAAGASPHVILVGLPGSGKTSVGQAVAVQLRRAFLDFDQEIERREGQPVRRIFAERGEAYFRSLERRLTEEMRAAGVGMILAPGGGWVTIPGVVDLVRPPSVVVYLAARPETALRRMGALRDRRPLLAESDPLVALRRLLTERGQLYEAAADVVIDTEPLDLQGVIRTVVDRISLFGGTKIMPVG